jgi:uncharacterized protein YciI
MMKKRILALAVCSLVGASDVFPQTPPAKPPDIGPGGYEMTTYYVGFLHRGPKWSPERTAETEALQNAHLANIQKMAQEGKLLVAGPFLDDGDLRGLYIFRVASMAEAESLASTDPAVRAGRLSLEFHPWYAAKNITVTARSGDSTPKK